MKKGWKEKEEENSLFHYLIERINKNCDICHKKYSKLQHDTSDICLWEKRNRSHATILLAWLTWRLGGLVR